MTTATIHEAKTNLSKLISRVEAGEEIVIARGKQPVVRLTALVASEKKREFGPLKGQFSVPDAAFSRFDQTLGTSVRQSLSGATFAERRAAGIDVLKQLGIIQP